MYSPPVQLSQYMILLQILLNCLINIFNVNTVKRTIHIYIPPVQPVHDIVTNIICQISSQLRTLPTSAMISGVFPPLESFLVNSW